jgi:hypothetical protein
MEFVSMSGQVFNTIHANNAEFYRELAAVIEREPIGLIDAETRGLLAGIGIRKGQPFAPDKRMSAILDDAVAVTNGTARALAFETREPEAYIYDDRTGSARSSEAITGGSATTGPEAATSTHERCSSTSPPSTPRRWHGR